MKGVPQQVLQRDSLLQDGRATVRDDTSLVERPIFRVVYAKKLRRFRNGLLCGLRRLRRQLSVRRVDDQRGPVGKDLRTLCKPEVVKFASKVGRCPRAISAI